MPSQKPQLMHVLLSAGHKVDMFSELFFGKMASGTSATAVIPPASLSSRAHAGTSTMVCDYGNFCRVRKSERGMD